MADVVSAWGGRRVRWEMMRVQPLCARASDCLAAPFAIGRVAGARQYAFLARLAFRDELEHRRMTEACAEHALECVITYEGTLALTFEPGTPAGMSLFEVRFVSARRRRDDEHYLSRPSPEVIGDGVPLRALGIRELVRE